MPSKHRMASFSSAYQKIFTLQLIFSHPMRKPFMYATINESGWHTNTNNPPPSLVLSGHIYHMTIHSLCWCGPLIWMENYTENIVFVMSFVWGGCMWSGLHLLSTVASRACHMHQFSVDDSPNKFHVKTKKKQQKKVWSSRAHPIRIEIINFFGVFLLHIIPKARVNSGRVCVHKKNQSYLS